MMIAPWVRLTLETARLAAEAGEVVALRLALMARGGRAAETEARRMVTEKIEAAAEAARAGNGLRAVKGYRRRVRANARRLRKG
ncbi:hypothetical protein [Methylobacterium sp. ID0610]|uniref:hypothetical protein n=1 Tax=Methylobacterium carpenticola TaxID=3344827 RepID=UPI0036859EE9